MKNFILTIIFGFMLTGGFQEMTKKPPTAEELAQQKKAAEIKRIVYENRPKSEKEKAMEAVKLENIRWERKRFGSAMFLTVDIKNGCGRPIKDVTVKCIGGGYSGTVIDNNKKVVYDIFNPDINHRNHEINMGFVHPDVQKITCSITDFILM